MNFDEVWYFLKPYGIINTYATDKTTSQYSSVKNMDSNKLMSIENRGFYCHEESNSEL